MDSAFENAISRSNAYPTDEAPLTFRTSANVFRYFRKTGLLLVSTPDYRNKLDGRSRMGKTISLWLRPLIEEPQALKALIDILHACRDQAVKERKTL